MDWGSTSEVKTSHLENPSRSVPCPACNWIVDDCTPDEHEDDGRKHATALRDSSDSKRNRDGSEHALVDGEQQIGDLRRTDGGSTEDISETNVFHITNIFASGLREGE
jgi:hypothetical protein